MSAAAPRPNALIGPLASLRAEQLLWMVCQVDGRASLEQAVDGCVRQAPPVRRAFDWSFRSRTDGRIVIAQLPNLSLWIFIVARVVGAFLEAGTSPASAAELVATLAIVWWGTDELVRGVNPWRRFLGAAVLVAQLAALLD